MTFYNAEYALMTQGFRQIKNLEVALKITTELESLGVEFNSIHISEYHKFENSTMIVLEIKIAENTLDFFLKYLASLSDYWQPTNKSDPKNHRVLDLRDKGTIYSGVVWASFDIV